MSAEDLHWRIHRIRQVPIENFLNWIKHPYHKQDRAYQISCPFILNHAGGEDRNPSARVYPDRNTIHCFAEGRSRDILDCIQEWYVLTLPRAVKFAERRLGLDKITPVEVQGQLETARTPKCTRIPLSPAECTIIDIVKRTRQKLSTKEKEATEPVFSYIWSEFDQIDRSAPEHGADEVGWERWAKALIIMHLKLVKSMRQLELKHPSP